MTAALAVSAPGAVDPDGPLQPAISVDTKKRELVGDFKNGGRALRAKGEPEDVQGQRRASLEGIVRERFRGPRR